MVMRMLAALGAVSADRTEVDRGAIYAQDDHLQPDDRRMLVEQFLRLWHMARNHVLLAAVLASGGAVVGRGGIRPAAARDHCPRDGLPVRWSGECLMALDRLNGH